MVIRFHEHARERMKDRGVSEEEILATVTEGETFQAKFGRSGFRRNFSFHAKWRGIFYRNKQVEVFAVQEGVDWVVITVIVRYF